MRSAPVMKPIEDRAIKVETVIAEVDARPGATCGGSEPPARC
jgi:hypothetical protein